MESDVLGVVLFFCHAFFPAFAPHLGRLPWLSRRRCAQHKLFPSYREQRLLPQIKEPLLDREARERLLEVNQNISLWVVPGAQRFVWRLCDCCGQDDWSQIVIVSNCLRRLYFRVQLLLVVWVAKENERPLALGYSILSDAIW